MTHTKRLTALWILLGIQILAAIWLWWPRQSGPATGQPWLSFSPQAVTRITLTDGSTSRDQALVLEKQDGTWLLPNANDFPAATSRVKQLLDTLDGLKGTLPVAVTEDAAKRFHVAAGEFETRVTLGAGKKQLAQVYVGNAAGANRAYLRRAGSDVIEAHTLPSRLLSADADNWRDPQILHLSSDDVGKVVLPHVTLVRQKAGWEAKGSKATLDAGKTRALVERLTHLGFVKVLGKKADHPLKTTTFKISLRDNGKTLVYHFAKVRTKPGKKNGGKQKSAKATWHMTRSDLPYVFTVSGDAAKKLQQASAKLLAKTPKTQGKDQGKSQDAGKDQSRDSKNTAT